jgi:hypothetical protein
MAHYAFINENNIVVEVIPGRNEDEIVDGISNWEEYYEQYREGLRCIRTSYNTYGNVHKDEKVPFRKNFGQVGFTYDLIRDAFIPPKPTEGDWILNEETCLWEEVNG